MNVLPIPGKWHELSARCPQERTCEFYIFVVGASRAAVRQARRARLRGAGGRLRNAGQRAGAVHALVGWAAKSSTGGRGIDDSRCRPAVCRRLPVVQTARSLVAERFAFLPTCARAGVDIHLAEIKSDSCPKRMSDKRGLMGFGCQFRHANAWRIGTQNPSAPTPQGSSCKAARG